MVNSLMVKERFLLAKERIWGIESESILQPKYRAYFVNVAQFLKMLCENWSFVEEGKIRQCPAEELKSRNKALYEDILPENYGESYGNPARCAEVFGREYGSILSFLYAEMRSLIPYVFEQRLENVVRGMEIGRAHV